MAELATVYVNIVASSRGLGTSLSRDLGAAGASAGSEAGKRFTGGMKGFLAGGAIAGVAASLTSSLTGMFGGFIKEAAAASDATDKFKATMSFAGLDTTAITNATKAAQAYADQTVFDLPTIQNTIAQLASNGVKDYTGLTKAAGNLNAVAGGNAETFKSVAMVMSQTAGAGKLTTENWNQLADAIPGAAGPLTKALQDAGAFTGNFRDAMAAGEITSDEFNTALMKLGSSPVAVEAAKSTKTFEGALGSLQATVSGGLTKALNAMKPALTGAINGLTSGLGGAFTWIGNAVTGLGDLFVKGDFTGKLRAAFHVEEDSAIVDFLFKIRDGAIQASKMWTNFKTGFTLPKIDTSGLTGPLATAINAGVKARAIFDEIKGGFKAMVAAFQAGDGDITSSGFAGFLESIGGSARKVFDAIAPAIAGLLPQIISLWSAFSPLQMIFKAVQPMLPTIVGAFGQLASTIGGTLASALTTLMPMFMQLSGMISQALGTVVATVLPVVIQMFGMLADTFSQLMPVVLPIIATVIELATSLISQLVPIITSLVSSILPPVVDIFGNILGAIGPLITMIAGLLIPVIQALMPVVVTVFGVVANVIRSVMQIIQGIIQVVTGIISGNWDQVWAGIQNIFSGIWNTIVAVIQGAIGIVWSVITNGLGLVWGVVSSVLGSIGQFFIDTWNNITSGVSGFIDGFLKFFTDLPGKIMDALAGAGKWLLDVGKNIVQGLIDGVGSMMGAIGEAILSIVPGPIVGVFKDALGIHSPSRVFDGFGVNIGQGLINGIDGMHSKVADATTGLAAVPSMTDIKPVGFTGLGGGPGGSAGPLVKMDIHASDGMDAVTVGQIAGNTVNNEMRRWR